MEKRRKHFAALRAQEKRNRPPTKAQNRTQMSTYLKHMGGYTYKQLNGKIFDEIQKLFDKEIKMVNYRGAYGFLRYKKAKKEGKKEDKESDKVKEVEEDDEAELKKHLMIKKDKDIAIDAIPIATKPPVIIDYKLHEEDREDLEALWKIFKIKYSVIRPEDEFERVLWGDLKVICLDQKKERNKKLEDSEDEHQVHGGMLGTENTPYCLEEQVRYVDYRDQYVVLSERVDTSYPTNGHGVSVDLSEQDT
ncbi:hypothetical protein Tco_1128837 [Tanacetum coccineum]